MKKILKYFFVMTLASAVSLSSLMIVPVFADDDDDDTTPSNICSGGTFLGLKAWYDGLECDNNAPVVKGDSQEALNKFVWRIVLNIAFDLFLVVGIIAAGFVIYAGYLFLTAGGDPGKAGKARKSLIASIVGIIVSLSATAIVNTITSATGPADRQGDNSSTVLAGAFKLALSIAGIVAIGFIIFSGITYITSSGDPGKAKRARMVLIYAIIGLLVVVTAYAIVSFVAGAVK